MEVNGLELDIDGIDSGSAITGNSVSSSGCELSATLMNPDPFNETASEPAG